ncbi:MAG: ABC transporter ATP-binding protein [Lachnospiraceae bacterium]
MAEDFAIKVENVTKIYKLYDKPIDRLKESLGLSKKVQCREHYALNDVSFNVKRGETVGIIGTNGSGKSTILKIITGVLNPTSGNVMVDGRISALLELGAGFNQEFTGIENVYLNGTMNGFSTEEIDAKLDSILQFADIGDFVNQPVKTYSSGMFVRLAFAVAINIEPEILIVDEALSVGDVFFQSKCYHKFEEFKEMGKTILIVSHDLSSIAKYCDKVVFLNQGVKMDEGEPKYIIDEYKKALVKQLGGVSVDDFDSESVADALSGQDGEKKTAMIDKPGDGASSANPNLWKSNLRLNPKVNAYGNGAGEIVDFAILDDSGKITDIINKGSEFTIRMKLRYHTHLEHPIAAFTIKDLKGTDLCGTNTMYEKNDIKNVEDGDEVVVIFTQKMDLQGGEYLLSLGTTGYVDGEYTVYHRLYDVCNMTVFSDKNTVGFYDMNSVVKVEY